jgi:hypothetical protein
LKIENDLRLEGMGVVFPIKKIPPPKDGGSDVYILLQE